MSDYPVTVPSQPAPMMVARRRYLPVATLVILGINFAMFLLMLHAGALRNNDVLLDFGASFRPYFRRGEWWRLVMPMFLHLGWWHLLVNSYALYILGPFLERVYGYGRFTLLYVATGIGSSLLSMTASMNAAAGASGAIFGISGVMLVTGFMHRDLIPRHWARAFGKGILPFIVVNLLFGFWVPGIDYWGHLGGLLSGMLLAVFVPPPGHDVIPGTVEEHRSEGMVILPVAVVLLSMAATASNYRSARAATQLLQEGLRLHVAHHDEDAARRFQEAAKKAPRDERPHEQLAALYLDQKKYDQAITEYQEAIRLSPGSPELPRDQLAIGLAYYLKGDHPKAQQVFESVLGKNPHSADAQRLLADLYAEQKLYGEAVQHYEEALRLNPGMAEAHNNLAWLFATSEDPKFRDSQAALDHAQRAVELSRWKEPSFVDTLAEAYYASGKYQDAVKVQTKALELDPNNKELQDHMARYRKAAGA